MSQRAPGPAFMLTLVAITLVGTMSIHLFLPLLPDVKKSFDASDAMVGATFSLALFVMAFSTLAYGSLSDRYGRRPVLVAGGPSGVPYDTVTTNPSNYDSLGRVFRLGVRF